MATPVMTKIETAVIAIDKVNRMFSVDIIVGSKDSVIFHANEDCLLHFLNYAVFQKDYLSLKKDTLDEEEVMAPNQTTAFEVFVPLSVETSKTWPIVPK